MAGRFLDAWAAGDYATAAGLTDDPEGAETLLAEAMDTLRVAEADFAPGPPVPAPTPTSAPAGAAPTPAPGTLEVPFRAAWTLETLGPWEFDGRVWVRTDGPEPVVDIDAQTVHPALSEGTRLGRERDLLPRAPILGAGGRPLMTERPVVHIGIEPRRLTAPARAYRAAGRLLDVDPAGLRARVAAAPPDQLVPVITLRATDFAAVAERLRAIEGYLFTDDMLTLAPTPTFGRALLGTVRPRPRRRWPTPDRWPPPSTRWARPACNARTSSSWPARPPGGSAWWTGPPGAPWRRCRSSRANAASRCGSPST